jgi:diguanylate cyclase (GGDEF)-like protein
VDPATLKKIEKMLVEGKKGTGTGADIRGIRILAGTVFQGKAPSTATTWTIIYFILGFVGVASVFFIFSIFRESNAPAFDALTGLLGKKDFLRKLKQYCRHDPAAQDPCAVLMISFQNFGNVLERYGYLLGDRALKEMGYLLRKTGRVKDVVARYENNVFGIILPGMDQDAAMQVASELRKAGADLLRNEKGEAVALEISCGISVFPKDGANSDLLVKKALDAATHGSLPERSGDSSHA